MFRSTKTNDSCGAIGLRPGAGGSDGTIARRDPGGLRKLLRRATLEYGHANTLPAGHMKRGVFVLDYFPAAALSAVELSGERGPWMKVQAGARFFHNTRASSSSTRAKSKVRAIFDDR